MEEGETDKREKAENIIDSFPFNWLHVNVFSLLFFRGLWARHDVFTCLWFSADFIVWYSSAKTLKSRLDRKYFARYLFKIRKLLTLSDDDCKFGEWRGIEAMSSSLTLLRGSIIYQGTWKQFNVNPSEFFKLFNWFLLHSNADPSLHLNLHWPRRSRRIKKRSKIDETTQGKFTADWWEFIQRWKIIKIHSQHPLNPDSTSFFHLLFLVSTALMKM